MKIEDLGSMMKADEEAYQAEKAAEALEAAQLGQATEEFNWDGTEEMEARYSTAVYTRYKDSKDLLGGMMAAFGDAAGFIGGLFGEK